MARHAHFLLNGTINDTGEVLALAAETKSMGPPLQALLRDIVENHILPAVATADRTSLEGKNWRITRFLQEFSSTTTLDLTWLVHTLPLCLPQLSCIT